MKHIWCTPVGTILCYSRSEDSKEACLISPEEGKYKAQKSSIHEYLSITLILLC